MFGIFKFKSYSGTKNIPFSEPIMLRKFFISEKRFKKFSASLEQHDQEKLNKKPFELKNMKLQVYLVRKTASVSLMKTS